MCGIAGSIDFSGRPLDGAVLAEMSRRLEHRGPDEQGCVLLPEAGQPQARPTAALLSRRLSIIDRAGGRQPVANEDRRIWAVLNGEIYNFAALRETLIAQGHTLRTHSDTEVLVHLYEERGDAFVEALDGMFALALWDDRRQRLILARDRAGKKPLVYWRQGPRFVFASEFQSLLSDPAIPRQVEPAALAWYLAYMAVPAPLSMFAGIHKVLPGHVLTVDAQGLQTRSYWQLRYEPKLKVSEAEAVAQWRTLFDAAVRKRLVGEVPVGVLLSGGLDSAAVAEAMVRLQPGRVSTFSIGFREAAFDESARAQRLAQALGIEHRAWTVGPELREDVPGLVAHFGEPFGDASALPTARLAREARAHVTVALSGEGGDEALAGYGRHRLGAAAEGWLAQGVRWAGQLPRAPGWGGRAQRFLRTAGLPRAERYRAWAGVCAPAEVAALLGPAAAAPPGELTAAWFDRWQALDAVDAMLAVENALYLPNDLLVKVDIASMAHALEVRAPFLDTELMSFAARLPSRFKLRGGTGKYLLRQALRGRVPESTLQGPKRGFAIPLAAWLRGPWQGWAQDHLRAAHVARAGWIEQPAIDARLAALAGASAGAAYQVWLLLMLELWHRAFMDGAIEAPRACGPEALTAA